MIQCLDKNRTKIILILTYYPVVRKTIKKLLSYRCHHFFLFTSMSETSVFQNLAYNEITSWIIITTYVFYINTGKIHADFVFKKSLDGLDSWVLFQMELACVGTVPNVTIQANTSKTAYFYHPRTGGKKISWQCDYMWAPTHAIYMISRPCDIL